MARHIHIHIGTKDSRFEELYSKYDSVCNQASDVGKGLRKFPRGPTGLPTEETRLNPKYGEMKSKYDALFAKQRAMADFLLKNYPTEMKTRRK